MLRVEVARKTCVKQLFKVKYYELIIEQQIAICLKFKKLLKMTNCLKWNVTASCKLLSTLYFWYK